MMLQECFLAGSPIDAVWLLPETPRTQEQFQWLAAEITEVGGDALLFQSDQLYATDADRLRQQFEETIDAEYRDILAALKRKGRDLAELSKRFQRAQGRDFFSSELGREVRERLLSIGGGDQK